MNQKAAARIAWAAASVIFGFTAAVFVLLYLNRAAIDNAAILTDAGNALIPVSIAGLGALIAARQPKNRIGWILLGIAGANALNLMAALVAIRFQLTGESSSGWAIWVAWFQSWSWLLYFPAGLMVLLFLLLPDGKLPSRRWRWLVWADLILTPILMAFAAVDPFPVQLSPRLPPLHNPVGLPLLAPSAASDFIGGVILIPALVLLLLTIVALLLRLSRSRGDERQQLKWIVFVCATVIVVLAVGGVLQATQLDPNGKVLIVAAPLGIGVALPASFAVAILKYRLYEIDIVISRTLVYGALAVFITAVYVGIVVGIGTLIGSGGKPNLALSVVATAIVAFAFQPVRERLQKVANRLVYGKRATPYEVLSEFSERVAETYAGEDVLPRMARVLADGTAADRAAVWLRAGDQLHAVAVWPETADGAGSLRVTGQMLPAVPDADRAVAVRHQGELLGALSVSKRKGESLTPVEEKLLTDLAGQAGLVLKNVGLTAELLARLEDLRASRQRLVAAQDDERRKLERNLHDGAQQNLVALKVKLGLAEMFVEKDPARAKRTLAELKVDTDEALGTLRDLARGIYPPLLADKGLVAALESQARKATLPVQVEADGVGRYPQEVEAAVYFCCLEALQNVQKYAAAKSAVMKLDGSESVLTFEVTDDGQGFDEASVKRGAGLTNMTDRIDALGGRLEVSSTPERGTRIHGSLPALVAVAPA